MADNWVTIPNGNFFIIGPDSVITEEMVPLLRTTPNIHKITYWLNSSYSAPVSTSRKKYYNQAVDLRLGAPRHIFDRIVQLYDRFFPIRAK